MQAYAERLLAQVPVPRRDVRRNLDALELPLERVASVCCLVGTASFFGDNVPNLQRFVADKAPNLEPGVTSLDQAARAFEGLLGAALRALDLGLLTQLAKYIDGPLLPGPGIQVLSANANAWKVEQVLFAARC